MKNYEIEQLVDINFDNSIKEKSQKYRITQKVIIIKNKEGKIKNERNKCIIEKKGTFQVLGKENLKINNEQKMEKDCLW